MIKELLTGRLWLRDTTTGEMPRRAKLADVVRWSRLGASATDSFPADGRWVAFAMVSRVGFDMSPEGGWGKDLLAKLIGVKPMDGFEL